MTVPSARTVRRMVRVARAVRIHRTWRQRLGDGYEIALTVVILGGIGIEAGRRIVRFAGSGSGVSHPGAVSWLLVALTVLLAGLSVRGLAAVGPLIAAPATRTFLISTPVDRAELLRARHVWTLLAGSAAGLLYGVPVGLVARSGLAGLVLSILVGGLLALALTAWSIRRQAGLVPWLVRAADLAVGVALLLALLVAVLNLAGLEPPVLAGGHGWLLGVAVVVAGLAVLGLWAGRDVRSRIGLAGLSDGAGLAGATAAAVRWFDPSLLSGLLTQRRWLRVASVRSTRLWGRSRAWVLLAAELRRLRRSRTAVLAGGALLVGCYALAAVITPVWRPVVQLVGATLAADRLAGGLRTVGRSTALRRAIGGSDHGIRLVHLVVPAVGAVVWSALTLPTVWAAGPLLGILYPALGAAAVVYRTATRPEVDYGAAATVDPAVSVVPIGLLTQLLRGPSLLCALVIVRILVA